MTYEYLPTGNLPTAAATATEKVLFLSLHAMTSKAAFRCSRYRQNASEGLAFRTVPSSLSSLSANPLSSVQVAAERPLRYHVLSAGHAGAASETATGTTRRFSSGYDVGHQDSLHWDNTERSRDQKLSSVGDGWRQLDGGNGDFFRELRSLVSLVEEFEATSTASEVVKVYGLEVLEEVVPRLLYLLDACAAARVPSAAKLTERILGHWINLSTSKDNDDEKIMPPGIEAYNVVIKAWANAGYKDSGLAARRSQQIFELVLAEEQQQRQRQQELEFRPNLNTYSALLKVWSRVGDAYRCERILEELMNRSGLVTLLSRESLSCPPSSWVGSYDPELVPDQACFHAVCKAWSNSSNSRASDEIRSNMKIMEKVSALLENDDLMPNAWTYNLLIHSFARRARRKSEKGRRSEKRGIGKSREDSLASSAMKEQALEAAEKAESVLIEMYEKYLEDLKIGKVPSFSAFDDENDDGRRAEKVRSTRPNISSYNGVINAWGQVGSDQGPAKAEMILAKLLQSCEGVQDSNDEVDERPGKYNLPIVHGLEPNLVTYNTIINCWGKSGSMEAGKRAEAILNFMNGNLFSKSYLFHPVTKEARWKIDVVRPDVVTYNSTINAWSKSGVPDGPERAEKLLRMMLDSPPGARGPIYPNAVTFATTIYAWSSSSNISGGERAEALLNKMIELYNATDDEKLRPLPPCYSGVIFAYANRGALKQAEDTAERMKEEGGYHLSQSIYNALLKGYAQIAATEGNDAVERSTALSRVQKAASVLADMMLVGEESRLSRPNIESFHYFLSTCASCANAEQTEREEALFIGIDAFYNLREYTHIHLEAESYVNIFDLVVKLLPKKSAERSELLEGLFKACCQDGFLTPPVLHRFRHWAHGDYVQRALGLSSEGCVDILSLKVKNLPYEWGSKTVRKLARGHHSSRRKRSLR